jgi:hypothetical protein
MKEKKKKKTSSKPAGVPGWAFGAGLVVLVGLGLWLNLAPSSRTPAMPGGTASTSLEWAPVVSQEHGFRMSLPASAQHTSGAAPGGDTPVASMWMAPHPTGVITVTVTHCPKVCEQAPDSVLKGAFESSVQEFGGKLLNQKPLQLPCPRGTCTGVDFEATSSQGLRIAGRYFIFGDKLFQLLGAQSSGSNEIFYKAVDSFTFL